MRVKCANCGMVYDINPTTMDFRTPHEVIATAQCPSCKSNAKDSLPNQGYNSQFRKELK